MNNKNNEILFMVCEPAPAFETSGYLRAADNFNESDFRPGYHFMHLVRSDPFHCLLLVLDSSALEDLQTQWSEWVHCTICSEYSAFSGYTDRRYLLRFAAHLHLLMDALHCVLDEWLKMQKQRMVAFAGNVLYRYLAEKEDAIRWLLEFTSKYTEDKARIYLWSVLDAVLDNGELFNISRKNLLFDYESLLCMLRAPYHMIALYPALFGIEAGPQPPVS